MTSKFLTIWDPIYKEITIDEDILKIIGSQVFQRLRRIKQTGNVDFVYPGATHTRFSHSLGAYFLSKLLFIKNTYINILSDYDKKLLSIACLLHDIGHGPLSHFFERITNVSHENYTKSIIKENRELNKILSNINAKLPRDLCNVFDKKYKNQIINGLMSSNIDLDRMDYLMRDSYHCGISIGTIDYQWILKNISINKNNIYFGKRSGSSIELFLINRYYMYKQVYLHRNVKAIDGMIILAFKIIRHLYNKKDNDIVNILKYFPIYKKLVENERLSSSEYSQLDDYNFWTFLNKTCKNSSNKILFYIIKSINKNIPFKKLLTSKISKSELIKIKNKFTINGFQVYFFDNDLLNPFSSAVFKNNPVFVVQESSSKIVNIEKNSLLIKGAVESFKKYQGKSNTYIYFPGSIKDLT